MTALLIVHGLVAVALLGALTHQTLATWAPVSGGTSFPGRFRGVSAASFAGPIALLYTLSTILGGVVYLRFRVVVRPALERLGHHPTLASFDVKEHFAAIGLALLPAYWVSWRHTPRADSRRTRTALTSILALVAWWSFLVGHVANNIRGFAT